jgi:steroid delta-isomerase-like uncharacterized protein
MTKCSYAVGALAAVSLLACAVEKKPPVSENGQAIVQAYVDAWNRHDSTAIDTLLAPNAIHEDIAQNFRGQGSAQIIAFMRKTIAAEPDFKWQVTNSIEEGREVALEWTWTATYSGPDLTGKQITNRRLSGRGASFAELENRKLKRITDYFDLASFFR